MMMLEKDKKWYVGRTRARQEKKIKLRLNDLGVENYIPLRRETRIYAGGRRRQVDVPLLPNLMFIRVVPDERFALLSQLGGLWMQYVVDRFTGSSMVVPDKQVEDFIRLVESRDATLSVEDLHLRKGDRVCVKDGAFAGLEGECLELRGKTRVIVRIEGLTVLSVEVPAKYLEKTGK
jgi:transcription antitermination factor NusG